MAQSATTVTTPNPTPPTNMSSTGATPPNPPNLTKNTYIDWLPDTDIFTTKGRWLIRRELESFLSDRSPEDIGQLCYYDLGFDCGYLSDYSCNAYQQVMTVQWAARRALEWLEGDRVYAWHSTETAVAA